MPQIAAFKSTCTDKVTFFVHSHQFLAPDFHRIWKNRNFCLKHFKLKYGEWELANFKFWIFHFPFFREFPHLLPIVPRPEEFCSAAGCSTTVQQLLPMSMILNFSRIFIFQHTSAREVVMLALQEFGITEYSSNYTLCEVKVDVSCRPTCSNTDLRSLSSRCR